MEKSIHTQKYKAFLELLREVRRERNLSQVEMAEKLGETQSFISKCERGERRLDVIELQEFCEALNIPLSEFIQRLEKIVR